MTTQAKSALNWFEIPVSNIEKAAAFYERTLGIAMRRERGHGMELAVFPYTPEVAVGGAIVAAPHLRPGATGTVVYLDCTGKLDACVARVADAGGKVVQPRTAIGENGFIAMVSDPDGNVVGLHSHS